VHPFFYSYYFKQLVDFSPKFRSYKPQDDSLKEKALEDAKAGDIEAEVKDQLQAATVKPVIEELVRFHLALLKIIRSHQ
jgi:hypothetical protein